MVPHRRLYSVANILGGLPFKEFAGNYISQSPIGTEKSGVQRDRDSTLRAQNLSPPLPSTPPPTEQEKKRINHKLKLTVLI